MSAQSSGTVTNGPGTGAPGGDEDPFCETFVTTLNEWCGTPPKVTPWSKGKAIRPSFNNMYFKNLAKNYPDVFKNMMREVPLIVKDVGTTAAPNVVAIFRASSVPAGHALAGLAGALLGAYNAANGPNWASMRQRMFDAFYSQPQVGPYKPAFPDGLSKDGKTWLEIKRPLDKTSEFQKAQHEKFKATGGTVNEAGCNCPGANCKNGEDCPEGYPPADPPDW
ncbi:hypothetical protein BE20_09075 [Sorangium cellulosum]|uniref:Uncharacterized protein n=1 Tax=Sorangium cellulosum TaxID=56 RepID=A0A150RBJ6_SORCE|nr:hypothetical protein BE18_17765 [Sorangium cellulosum]KYF93578.1 hypothetical protein BE20_09075 [Sorangium cellulosum]